jgi:UDP-N-acetylmuramoyl-tripeptide--D-alanyl-D-alanine ligase
MPYSIDTRTLEPGDIFVAIQGETHDGHDFIPQAIEKGATGVVTQQDVDVPERITVTRVESTLDYLIEQAVKKVRHLNPDIVAITGSIGKTTTKTAISTVLGEVFDVVPSEGNKNTPLGLSLLVLNRDFTSQTKLILEMGARFEGDIRKLCTYFPPTVAVVTNVRRVHVETFGSINDIQREKSEIVRALNSDGTACLNGDDPRVLAMANINRGETITYGTSPNCDLGPNRITVSLPILGKHAVDTALAAMSVGVAFGMSDEQINEGLTKIKSEKGRLNRLRGRNSSILIDDTYNASPESMIAALHVLEEQESDRRIAFLGDMLELGEDKIEEHAHILNEASEIVNTIHAVGKIMEQTAETLPPHQREQITLHENSSELAAALRAGHVYEPKTGDVILVKGSQGTRMERVSEILLHPDLEPKDLLPRQSKSWKQI